MHDCQPWKWHQLCWLDRCNLFLPGVSYLDLLSIRSSGAGEPELCAGPLHHPLLPPLTFFRQIPTRCRLMSWDHLWSRCVTPSATWARSPDWTVSPPVFLAESFISRVPGVWRHDDIVQVSRVCSRRAAWRSECSSRAGASLWRTSKTGSDVRLVSWPASALSTLFDIHA